MVGHVRSNLIAILLIIVLLLAAGCTVEPAPDLQSPTVTPTRRPQPTSLPLSSTPALDTPQPPEPALQNLEYRHLDLAVDLPLRTNDAVVPEYAIARIGIGRPSSGVAYFDEERFMVSTTTGLYVYSLPDFDLQWQVLQFQPLDYYLTRDGTRLTYSHGGYARPQLHNAATHEWITGLEGWQYPVWSPDESMIAVEENPPFTPFDDDFDGKIHIFLYTRDGDFIRSLDADFSDFDAGRVFSTIEWSADSRQIAGCTNVGIYVWDVATGQLLAPVDPAAYVKGPYQGFYSLDFSQDGRYLAVQNRRQLGIFDLQSQEPVFDGLEILGGHDWLPNALLLSREDLSWELLATDSWEPLYQSDSERERTSRTQAGDRVAVAARDGIHVFDTATYKEIYTIPLAARWVDWSPDGTWLLASNSNQAVVFDGETGESLYELNAEYDTLFADDEHILSFEYYRMLLIDIASGQIVDGIRTGIPADEVHWSADGQTLVISGSEGKWYWSLADGSVSQDTPPNLVLSPVTTEYGETEHEYPTAATLDGTWLVEGGSGGFMGCGDGPTEGGCFEGGTVDIFKVGLDHDNELVASIETEGGIRVLEWSPNQQYIAVGQGSFSEYDKLNSTVTLIDANSGSILLELKGHDQAVTDLAFSPDGLKLASTSEDGTIIIWDAGF